MKTLVKALTLIWEKGEHKKPGEQFLVEKERGLSLIRSRAAEEIAIQPAPDPEPEPAPEPVAQPEVKAEPRPAPKVSAPAPKGKAKASGKK